MRPRLDTGRKDDRVCAEGGDPEPGTDLPEDAVAELVQR
jgi:hypothetical protein